MPSSALCVAQAQVHYLHSDLTPVANFLDDLGVPLRSPASGCMAALPSVGWCNGVATGSAGCTYARTHAMFGRWGALTTFSLIGCAAVPVLLLIADEQEAHICPKS
jgi:hypothetical protein